MINWIEVDNAIQYKHFIPYYTDEVVAINDTDDVLIGYLAPMHKGGLACEAGDTVLEDVKYYAPVEELLKSVRIC